jgi:hypothetical protein
VLAGTFGYLLLYLSAINRALWNSGVQQAQAAAAAVAGRHYAAVAAGAIGAALTALPIIGTGYVIAGLARRAATASLRWSAGRPARQLLGAAAALGFISVLALFWAAGGQFRGW